MHEPRPGRRAFICLHKEHTVPIRIFQRPTGPEPRCEKHGKMQRQENQPYLGQKIPEMERG